MDKTDDKDQTAKTTKIDDRRQTAKSIKTDDTAQTTNTRKTDDRRLTTKSIKTDDKGQPSKTDESGATTPRTTPATSINPLLINSNISIYLPTDLPHLPDFILVWKTASSENEKMSQEYQLAQTRRIVFERNLRIAGLILEPALEPGSGFLRFMRIYGRVEQASLAVDNKANDVDVLRKYAEILKIRVPMKKIPEQPEDSHLSGNYSRDKEYLFDMEGVFTDSLRSSIVGFILDRTRYTDLPFNHILFGIDQLIKDKTYVNAYPVHEPIVRDKLRENWASIRRTFSEQPLDEVMEYFGVKVGLYFAWLGFYTKMLRPAAVVGLICFIYGCVNTAVLDHLGDEICHPTEEFKETPMCPVCDQKCDYWDIDSMCIFARATLIFDNYLTIFFAFFMSIWSAVYLELWKRHIAEIHHRWGLTTFDVKQEQPRSDYLAAAYKNSNRRSDDRRSTRTNPVTNFDEPFIPFLSKRLPNTSFSVSAVLFLVMLPAIALFSVICYRISMTTVLEVGSYSNLVITSSAAMMNLMFIVMFNTLYGWLAVKLTILELHRTQSAFDNSLILKMYIVKFINFYSSIIYVAFFKGRLVGTPGKYITLFGFRQEECGPIGCMTELCIQLAVIMVGNQFLGAFEEMGLPILKHWWRKKRSRIASAHVNLTPWVADYALANWTPQSLFKEYLEMVIQYGFVTLFVAAFPLAPLFALLNNLLEVRLDAKKFLNEFKRPVAQRVKNIGSWSTILVTVSNMAIISNALIIALTSTLIPRFVYYAEFGTYDGYLNHTLAYYNVSDFENDKRPDPPGGSDYKNVTYCRFTSYSAWDAGEVDEDELLRRTIFYWKLWVARLIFIIVFQNVVTGCVVALKWIIPDVPKKLTERINRENYWTMEAIIRHEMIQQLTASSTRRTSQSNLSPGTVSSKPSKQTAEQTSKQNKQADQTRSNKKPVTRKAEGRTDVRSKKKAIPAANTPPEERTD